jgi:hypothetical protein
MSYKKSTKISKKGKETFKQKCGPLFDIKKNKYKTKKQIINKFRCKKTKTGKELLYFKRGKEYLNIPKKQLHEHRCFKNYNKYYTEDKSNSESDLTMDDLLTGCSKTQFEDINPEYVKLSNFVEKLDTKLDVDDNITSFIKDLVEYTNINLYGIKEIFNGAFVVIKGDHGYFFKKYKLIGRECKLRIKIAESSHDSLYKNPQYRMGNGVLYNYDSSKSLKLNNAFDLLVGTSPIEEFYGDTWIQFEYANIKGFVNKYMRHVYSFLKYKLSGKNVGPLGTSEYTEYTKPLILEVCVTEDGKPIKCIRSVADLKADSSNFIRDNNIILYEHKLLKDYIKNSFGFKVTMKEVNSAINDYTVSSQIPVRLVEILKQVQLYIVDNFNPKDVYEREEIVEIMFLILYYINKSKSKSKNLKELKNKLKNRYY